MWEWPAQSMPFPLHCRPTTLAHPSAQVPSLLSPPPLQPAGERACVHQPKHGGPPAPHLWPAARRAAAPAGRGAGGGAGRGRRLRAAPAGGAGGCGVVSCPPSFTTRLLPPASPKTQTHDSNLSTVPLVPPPAVPQRDAYIRHVSSTEGLAALAATVVRNASSVLKASVLQRLLLGFQLCRAV